MEVLHERCCGLDVHKETVAACLRLVVQGKFVKSDAHLISWACICPRNDESAGTRRSSRIRKGSPWLKTTLVQCAWAAARTKGS